jgi:two-component system OmpR family response regulator
MERLHGRDAGPFDRSVDLQVSRLRQKIEENARVPKIIRTIRHQGYILTVPVRVEYGC